MLGLGAFAVATMTASRPGGAHVPWLAWVAMAGGLVRFQVVFRAAVRSPSYICVVHFAGEGDTTLQGSRG